MNIKYRVITAFLACSMSLTLVACDKKEKEPSASQALAEITATITTGGFRIASETLDMTDEQRSCLRKVTFDKHVPKVKKLFEKEFNKDELALAYSVHSDPEVIELFKYSMSFLHTNGEPEEEVDEATAAARKRAGKKLEYFHETELGKRFTEFMQNTSRSFPIKKKLKECDVKV